MYRCWFLIFLTLFSCDIFLAQLWFGTKPPGATCIYDVCKTSVSFCQNDGQCSLNLTNCHGYCICPSGFTGSKCETEIKTFNCSECADDQTCEYIDDQWSCVATTSTQVVTMETVTSDVNVTMNVTFKDACSVNYRYHSEEDRKCPAFTCGYGLCSYVIKEFQGKNTTLYQCKCDYQADGDRCQYQCCKDCGQYGRCEYLVEDKYEFCNCDGNHYGEHCNLTRIDKTDPFEEEEWYWVLVGACSGAFVLLVLLLVAMPYCLWKRRALVVMKIAYYFQPYEDDDEKEWDAFVSYKSNCEDETFVINKLRPFLEDQLGFKLCLHFRDFSIGGAIADNVLHAIYNSRRTIILLSPNYVISEWTRYEYQVALQEMLKQKHRIIPIILEDISQIKNMDDNLQQIISSITYLEWPKNERKEECFWKKIELSLPKKKSSSSRVYSSETLCSSVYSGSDTTSRTTCSTISESMNTSENDHDKNKDSLYLPETMFLESFYSSDILTKYNNTTENESQTNMSVNKNVSKYVVNYGFDDYIYSESGVTS